MMKPDSAVTIVLLAGGRATRLPGKLALPIGGESMVVKVYRQLTNSGLPCIVSIREKLSDELARHMPSPAILDDYLDAGPLGGLATAAARVRTPLLFATAGDLPNIDSGVVDVLLRCYLDEGERSKRKPDVVLPRHADGTVEPLAALYDTAALLGSATRTLEGGRRKVTDALEGLRVMYYDIPSREESKYLNINTAEDLAGIRTP